MKRYTNAELVTNTLENLKFLKTWRANGGPVSYTTDIEWLIDMAINRRAGWPDDPSDHRGSCMPVNGKYPKKAEGCTYSHLKTIAREINAPRLIVRMGSLGEWRKLILKRVPHRIWDHDGRV